VIELGHRTERKPPFRYAAYTRVAFSDTDAQGVVYYGRYLPYFDLARTEYHRQLGPVEVQRSEFVMRHSSVEYLAPARFDDLLEVFVRIDRIGRSSVTYVYAAHRLELDDSGALVSDALMVTATQALVLIDHSTRETLPVPERFRLRASEFEGVEFGGAAPPG
jgi:acyl-CoA thioester hydrolase